MTTPLERLKQDLEDGSEPEPWTLVKKRDLSLALVVVDEAARFCAGTEVAYLKLKEALSALTEDTK